MHDAGIELEVAVEHPDRLSFADRIGDRLRTAIRALTAADMEVNRSRSLEPPERVGDCPALIPVHGITAYTKRVYEPFAEFDRATIRPRYVEVNAG